MRPRALNLSVAAVAAAVVLAACGGSSGGSSSGGGSSNGIASKSPEQIVAAVAKASQGLSSVHIHGSIVSGGQPVSLDLTLVTKKGATGSLSASGLSFKITAVGNAIYLQGSSAFWSKFGGSAAAALLDGKWLKVPASNSQFGEFSALTNSSKLFQQLLDTHGSLEKVGTTTVDGRQVIGVKDKTKGGTLYVATSGPPYPIEVSESGKNHGSVHFDNFNAAVTLTAPSPAIDVSKLGI
jgi:hypothetical protein